MTRNWVSDVPGASLGFWGWGTWQGANMAHGFRRGYGMKSTVCGLTIPNSVEMPHPREDMCPTCASRISALETEHRDIFAEDDERERKRVSLR